MFRLFYLCLGCFFWGGVGGVFCLFFMPPLKKRGQITLHMSVGRSVGVSVSLNLVQLITQEHFTQEPTNLVVR